MKNNKREREIAKLERLANDERTSIPERLHLIYRILFLRGIEIPGYLEHGKAV